MRRHVVTPLLWLFAVGALGLLVVRGVPWIWPQLFPADHVTAPPPAPDAAPSPEYVSEVLSRFLAGWGQHLPSGAVVLELPPGRRPVELQAGLRREPRLAGLEIYVTAADELHHTLRVFSGPTLLLERSVRPWLPERPIVSSSDRPELGVVVLLEDEAHLRRLGGWKAPLALAIPPFAPHAARSARQASWDGKGVVVVLDPAEDLSEQSRALSEASIVLLRDPLPEGLDLPAWLTVLASQRLALLDGRPGSRASLEQAAHAQGVPWLPVAGALSDAGERRVVWARTQRRGGGIVLADASDEGLRELESFIEASRDVGFSLVLPAEVFTAHGSPPAP